MAPAVQKHSTSEERRDAERDTLRGAIEQLVGWITLGSVGTFVIKRTHIGAISAATESVIKLRELPEAERETIRNLMKMHNAMKLLIICDGYGEPDRIEVNRFCNLK